MRVRTATIIFSILILSLFVLLGFSLMKMTGLLADKADDLSTAAESIEAAQALKLQLLTHNRNVYLYSYQKNPARPASSATLRREVMDILERVKQLNGIDPAPGLIELESGISSYLQKMYRLEESDIPATEQYWRLSKEVDTILPVVDDLILSSQARMQDLMETIEGWNKMANKIGSVLLIVGGAVLLGLTGMLFVFIGHPLKVVAETISYYTDGNASARVRPGGLMEIRRIGSNFNSMADRLEEKQRDQLRFIAAIAHDLRNPLNAMTMASELLNRKSDPESRNLVGMIRRQVKNLDRMVGDLLDTARIEAGYLDLKFDSFDISSLIEDSVNLYRPGSDLHLFRVNLSNEPLVCQCDGARISQVLNNLLSNAVKYSPNGGAVTVRARRAGNEVIVSVTDEGIGIAHGELEQIFKPFSRTQATRDTIQGIGLGLSTSRHIVEGHGGALWVESGPGSGSTFFFSLPVKRAGSDNRPLDGLPRANGKP